MFKFIWELPRTISKLFIRAYQRTLSLDHGPLKSLYPYGFCKFQPSCSQYGHEALHRHGFVVGWIKTLWRILRCNPFTRGGNDPV